MGTFALNVSNATQILLMKKVQSYSSNKNKENLKNKKWQTWELAMHFESITINGCSTLCEIDLDVTVAVWAGTWFVTVPSGSY